MSRRILATMPAGTTYPNLLVEVACAFGADITDLDGSGWTWTDITDDVILEGEQGSPLNTTVGRADESTVTQTSVFKCTLDNRSGKYINTGASALWPYVRRGTPVRMRLSIDNGSTWSVRFQGTAVGFTPQWPESTGRWATVELEASGPLRVLDQGTLPAMSAMMVGTINDPTVTDYWPCDDQQGSTFVRPAKGLRNGTFETFDPATSTMVTGVPGNCAAYTEMPSSGPMVTLQVGGGLGSPTGSSAYSSSTTSAIFAGATTIPNSNAALLTVYTPNGSSIKAWEIDVPASGELRLCGYATVLHSWNTSTVFTTGPVSFNLLGNIPYEIGLRLTQSGGTTSYRMFAHAVGATSATWFDGTRANSGTNACGVDDVTCGTYASAENLSVGHVVVRNGAGARDVNADTEWLNGYMGEAVTTRFPRVANQSNVNVDILAPGVGIYPAYTETANSITLTSGPQYWDTLSNTLRETESTGQGLLYDGLGTGLTYVSRRFRQQRAIAATLTLDANAGHLMEPFGPVDDDQVLFNHVTASRHGGNQGVEYLDVTGPEGANIVGDHANSLTVNPNTDDGLVGYAQWGVNVGTITGYRFPQIGFALHTNASLIPQWLACTPQSRIDITNISSVRRQLSPDPIWLLLEGWTETIDAFEWKVQANTSSAEPWNVIRLAAATGSTGDDICHMDTDSSQLNTSAALGATSISVRTNSGPLWVQSTADADSFPFWITVGGLRVQVTAISGAASPQTFTLASPGLAAAKTGSTTPGAGAPINIWRPPVLGL